MESVRSGLDEIVIMVHGTFAGDEERRDEGGRWWQRGSEVWSWFERHLPEGTRLPDSSLRLFHWSGENSQIDRLEASNRLLALLLEMEQQGRGYHLVGHSHGGSIIWETLISAEVTQSRGIVDPVLRRAAHRAMDRFSGRWLALWATEDEAIAGLDWLAEAPATVIQEAIRTPPQDRSERSLHKVVNSGFAGKLLRLRRPIGDVQLIPHVQLLVPMRIANPVIWAYNKLLAPAVGRAVLKTVIRRTQGANLPHASLVHSSPWPLPLSGICPGLPADVENEIHERASRDAGHLGSIARKLPMTAALEGVPAARHAIQHYTDRGSPLVHTSYFDHESVRRLVNLHIHRRSAKLGVVAPADELATWLAANSNDVRKRLDQFAATTRR